MMLSDVYDSPEWKERMRDAPEDDVHIVLLLAVDAIPAFKKYGISLLLAEFLVLSLPPWLRYKADNMLITMILPHTMSADSQRKFFNYAIKADYNVLLREGVDGPYGKMPVKIFGLVGIGTSYMSILTSPSQTFIH